MKKKLFKLLFMKEFNEFEKELEFNHNILHQLIEENKIKNEKQYKIINIIFNFFPSSKIIGYSLNNNKEELLIVLNKDTIYLFGEKYQILTNLPSLIFTIQEIEKDIFIRIDDINMIENNIGNGSIAMKALINYANEIGAKEIKGSLSSIDDEHIERLYHFYKKFGFEIINQNIKLKLDNC